MHIKTLIFYLILSFNVVQDESARIVVTPKEGSALQSLVIRPMASFFKWLATCVISAKKYFFWDKKSLFYHN